jgi:Fe-S-cluster containining protein
MGQFKMKFKCLLCGEECCTFKSEDEAPLVFPWEKRLLERIGKERGFNLLFKPYLAYRDNNNYIIVLYRWIIRGRCPFLSSNGLCSIHEDKPLSCKMYPLIIGLDDNTLRVSGLCEWVRKHIDVLKNIDPSKIFPNEYKYALKTFILLKIVDELAHRNKWKRIIFNNNISYNYHIDTIKFVDIDMVLPGLKDIVGTINDS